MGSSVPHFLQLAEWQITALPHIWSIIHCLPPWPCLQRSEQEFYFRPGSDILRKILGEDSYSILSRLRQFEIFRDKDLDLRASLVAQLRIRLPMQGTQVRSLVREDPASHGATKPLRHSY